jgi:glycyl-tRNA synthetase
MKLAARTVCAIQAPAQRANTVPTAKTPIGARGIMLPSRTKRGTLMSESPAAPIAKTMDAIVALCRRRGFVFQSSEIYGGINGFWDYGPLGVELKKNLKDAWWQDIVRCPGIGPDGNLISMVGVDCTIIMNPKVWVASGHAAGFNDPMVDDIETKQRFRADHLWAVAVVEGATQGIEEDLLHDAQKQIKEGKFDHVAFTVIASSDGEIVEMIRSNPGMVHRAKKAGEARFFTTLGGAKIEVFNNQGEKQIALIFPLPLEIQKEHHAAIPSPFKLGDKRRVNVLTEPRQFNLMFQTYVGAVQSEDSMAYLRPETAQGIFANFRNVLDTSRVKVPFGIAQIGKAFRNEVTPRNFTFRSREFEQMEIEFFIRPDDAKEWYKYWRDSRYAWWKSIGLAGDNLQLREHDKDELAHYAKTGEGTSDIEYRFPFTAPGFGELEGIAHRGAFDLSQHAEHSGLKDKLKYFDQDLQLQMQAQAASKEEIAAKTRYFPHVIEPSAGADRGTLAAICEAFTPDASRASGVYMKFHPRLAPVKAGVFPLVNKDGMPEVAEKLYMELRKNYTVEYDPKQTIGKRYARMDESGTPFCFTVDGDTLTNQTVTVRDRDTQAQERVSLDKVSAYLSEKING